MALLPHPVRPLADATTREDTGIPWGFPFGLASFSVFMGFFSPWGTPGGGALGDPPVGGGPPRGIPLEIPRGPGGSQGGAHGIPQWIAWKIPWGVP